MFLVAAALLVAGSQAGTRSKRAGKAGGDVREQLKKMEQDRVAAVVKADVATLDRLTDDNYIMTDSRGQVSNKQETLDAIKSGKIKIQSNEFDDLKVTLYGDTAVVTGKRTSKGSDGGHEITGSTRFTRVLVKRGGQWKSVAFQQTNVSE